MNTTLRATPSSQRLLVQHTGSVEGGFEVDYATQVTAAGLFIHTDKPVPQNSTLHVQFAPARDARLVSGFARVTQVLPHGFSAQFIGLDGDAAQLITQALA